MVFTKTKHGADKLCRKLHGAGISATAIHGNKGQNQRDRALDAFRIGKVRVLVATDVAARGLDVDGITHVFNFDLPMEPEAYVHRIGRTGRAGATGIAISMCDAGERDLLRDIERLTGKRIPTTPTPSSIPQLKVREGAEMDVTHPVHGGDFSRSSPGSSRPHRGGSHGGAPRGARQSGPAHPRGSSGHGARPPHSRGGWQSAGRSARAPRRGR